MHLSTKGYAEKRQLTGNEEITARSFNSSPNSRKAGQSDKEHKEHRKDMLPRLKHHKKLEYYSNRTLNSVSFTRVVPQISYKMLIFKIWQIRNTRFEEKLTWNTAVSFIMNDDITVMSVNYTLLKNCWLGVKKGIRPAKILVPTFPNTRPGLICRRTGPSHFIQEVAMVWHST